MVRLWTGGRGGVDTDVDDPDLLAGGGEELVARVEVGGVIPPRPLSL
ncbi:hypothetical protein [Saccharomonospora viridis]|nr:hypothetical protein [Saccharomonospora viridis]